jgi:hypothetical protein
MSDAVYYEASVYSRKISYKNFKGEEKTAELNFALDPLQLMTVMATYVPKKIKSGNPALNGRDAEMSDEEQIRMVRALAMQSAGTPSEDGETWEPFEGFDNTIVGKAFLTKLVSSDADRREFSEKVIVAPFEAFVRYFESDPSNSPKEIAEIKDMLNKIKKIFATPDLTQETSEERAARLKAELMALEGNDKN